MLPSRACCTPCYTSTATGTHHPELTSSIPGDQPGARKSRAPREYKPQNLFCPTIYLRQNVSTLQFFAFNFGFSFLVLICQQNSGIRRGSGAPAVVNSEVCVHRVRRDGARALAKPGGMRAHAF